MNKIKSIFGELDGDYLRRNYIIGGLWGVIWTRLWIRTLIENNEAKMFIFASVLYFALCIALFPFAAYVWDSVVSFVMGDSVIFLPLVIMGMWKLMKLGMLYMFAVFIAPIGIVYLLFQQKKRS